MVCYGPSKGCMTCRKRKIKCDERRPGCRQCEKSKRQCPGYDRGDGEIAFRDETGIVSGKSRNPTRGSTEDVLFPPSSSESGSASVKLGSDLEGIPNLSVAPRRQATAPVVGTDIFTSLSPDVFSNVDFNTNFMPKTTSPIVVANEFVPLGLPQDPEQQSLAFFMTKFAHDRRSEEIWGGCLEALPTLLEKATAESPLRAAATTTAMGSMAWSPGYSRFKTQSVQKYVTSLQRIKEALKDPEQATSDNVLMAVLMLGFYENIKSLTSQRPARESHVKGAVALIKARRSESFHDQISLRLYLAVRAQLLGQCIENCDPAPFKDFLAATEGIIPDNYVPSCADRLVLLSMELPNLRLHEKQMLDEANNIMKRSAAQALLQDAQNADAALETWTSTVSEEFLFTSLPLRGAIAQGSSSPDKYPQNVDIYSDHPMASTWNTWRITRIYILRMVMNCADILKPPQATRPPSSEHKSALHMIHQLVNDICSSVPFHLGHHERHLGDTDGFTDYPHPPGEAKWPENFAASGAVGGWLMMQPLSFVARLNCIPSIQRDWVREYLNTFMRGPSERCKAPEDPSVP